jgi:hypothetical protein
MGCLVLGTPPVLDAVVFALIALHDPVDATRRVVLAVIVEATLVDVAASIATTTVLVEVGA